MAHLKSVSIKNYRLLRDVEIPLDRVNLFVGPTGSGKTSLRMAAEYAILRTNELTDGRGTGIVHQVRHGAKAGRVTLELDDASTVSCEFPKEKDAQMKRAAALHSLGLTDRIAPVLFRGQAFLDRTDAERRDDLQRVLGVDTSDRHALTQIDTWDERFPDLAAWVDSATADLQWIGTSYRDLAEERRRVAGRLKDETEKRLAPLRARVLDADGEPAPPLPVPSEELLEAQGRRDEILHDIGSLDAAEAPAMREHQAAVRAWQAEMERHDAAVRELDRLEAELARAQADLQPPPASYRPAATLQLELASMEARMAELQEVLGQRRSRLASLTAERKRVSTSAALTLCPTCAQPWSPQTESEIRRLDEEIVALHQPCPEEDELTRVRSFHQQTSQAAIWAARHDSQVEAARAAVARLSPRVEELRQFLGSWMQPTQPEPPASQLERRHELLAQLSEVDALLLRLQSVREVRLQWERDFAHLEQLALEHESRLDEWARWDSVYKALDPRALKARISADAVAGWAAEVDADCRRAFGLGFRCSLGEKAWEFDVWRREGWVPQAMVSDGERLLVSAAIQVSFARRTGLRVVWIDEVSRADGKVRNALVAYLLGSGVQAVLCSPAQTWAREQWVWPRNPGRPGLAMWWVEEGNYAPIPAEASR